MAVMKGLTLLAVPLAVLAFVMPACSESSAIEVQGTWARSPADDVAAVYFVVVNDGDTADTLVGASADVTGRVEIHETVMQDGEAEMQPVESISIPAGEELAFEPGGYHVMLFDLAEPLEIGDTIALTLTFEEAGEIEIDAEVREFVGNDMTGGAGEDDGM